MIIAKVCSAFVGRIHIRQWPKYVAPKWEMVEQSRRLAFTNHMGYIPVWQPARKCVYFYKIKDLENVNFVDCMRNVTVTMCFI